MENEEFKARLENLEANQISLLIVTTALIQSHPLQTALHLQMTSVLEQQIGEHGTLGALLNARQKENVREFVERLGGAQNATAGWRPPQSPEAQPKGD